MKEELEFIFETGWQTKKNQFYNVTTSNDSQITTNQKSYYGHLFPAKDFSVEVSNQKMQASISEKGLIKAISFFRDAYFTEDKPGTWVSNGFVQEENISTEIEVNGHKAPLDKENHQIEYDLLFNLIPRFIHHYPDFTVLQLFLPIYLESGESVSGLIELCALRNDSSKDVKLIFPKCYHLKYSDRHNVELNYANNQSVMESQASWVTLTDPNAAFNVTDEEMSKIIISSYNYLIGKYGQLEIPTNPELATLITRKAANALNSISESTNGKVVGANWGSSPVVDRTWLRDMFYASLPAIYFDHELAKKVILWFAQYEIKPKGGKFNGGIQHSVENSLNSAILLTLYLTETNDFEFLKQNSQMWEHVLYVVNYLIARRDSKFGLIKSQWISDGIALGEFHTGTQITFWAAIKGIGKIYREVLNQPYEAKRYEEIADELKKQILEYCLIEDNQGRKRFIEGVNPENGELATDLKQYQTDIVDQGLDFLTRVIKEDKITLEFHDGEESDTTLAPFYGFNDVLEGYYLGTLQFASSSDNPTYSKLSKGISWGDQSEATFPGYITLLMGTVNDHSRFMEKIDILEKLTDLDGSWWWWPYEVGSSGDNVMRFNHCGKCGWSDGSFSVLMIKNVLGIEFNAQKDLLKIRPLAVAPSFNWNDFPLADDLKVNLSYQSENGHQKLIANLYGAEQRKVTLEFKPQSWSTGISKDLTSDTKVRFEKERN